MFFLALSLAAWGTDLSTFFGLANSGIAQDEIDKTIKIAMKKVQKILKIQCLIDFL